MSSRFPLFSAFALSLALAPASLAAAATGLPVVRSPGEGLSAWIDGVWAPVAGAGRDGARHTVAFASAAAAATNEGSLVVSMIPLFESDGSAEVAVFVATVDGETCLWRTDGTAAGTFRVEPEGGCLPFANPFFVALSDGIAYFVAGPGLSRYWRTDGTAAGTWPLTSFSDPGLAARASVFPLHDLGMVLLVASDGVNPAELWVSDGGPESAQRLAAPGLEGRPFAFQLLGSQVLFFVYRGGVEYELWKTDGTVAGTALVEVVGSEEFYAGPRSAYRVGDRVAFFLGGIRSCTVELWATDGTAAGTEPIRAFRGTESTTCPGSGTFQAARADGFGDSVFFATDDGESGVELWRTDGTAAGTVRLTDLAPPQPFRQHFPLNFPPVGLGGAIRFAADDGTHGMEPWTSDGTPGGAGLLADVCPGACSSTPGWMKAVGGRLLFSAEEPAAGRELWASDGTSGGTQRVTDLCSGPCGANIFRETSFGDSLLFIADDGSHGEEWWRWAPPAGPAVRLTDFAPAQPFGSFLNMTPLGGLAVFTADDGIHGREPWVTDGTPVGTHLLVDLQGETVAPEVPAAPSGLTVEILGGGRVRLQWQDNSDDEHGFFIEHSLFPDSWVGHPVDANVSSHTLTLEPGHYRLRVRAYKELVGFSDPSNEVEAVIGSGPEPCTPNTEDLCLGQGRFRIRVEWRNQRAAPGQNATGFGQAVQAGGGIDDSGYFWFFTPDNLELVVKVLDGRTVNGHFWVFWGGLSDVEYRILVEDTLGGGARTYLNPAGQICGGADTAAFTDTGTAGGFARRMPETAPPAPASSGTGPAFAAASGPATRFVALDAPAKTTGATHPPLPCTPDDTTLCLLDGLLWVTVDWSDHRNGGSGVGHAIPYTELTGFFWFFDEENVELVVKALDGRTVNGKIWVFYGGLSDVGYTIRVAYDEGHAVREYVNPPGTICGRGDTAAF